MEVSLATVPCLIRWVCACVLTVQVETHIYRDTESVSQRESERDRVCWCLSVTVYACGTMRCCMTLWTLNKASELTLWAIILTHNSRETIAVTLLLQTSWCSWSLINPRDGIVLQTQLDDLCDKLEWSSVVAWQTTVQFITIVSVHLSRAKLITRFNNQHAVTKFSKYGAWAKVSDESTLIFVNMWISLPHSAKEVKKTPRKKTAWFVQPFHVTPTCDRQRRTDK